jgi:fatty acid desaturase
LSATGSASASGLFAEVPAGEEKRMSKLAPLRFLAFPVLAFTGQWFWMQNFSPTSVLACAFWIPLLAYSWFCVGGLAHELVHENLLFGPRASRFIGTIIGTAIGIPHTVYREIHMRHHAYLNTPLDWELWPYSDPNVSLGVRRVFIWFDMLCGSLATPLIWGRICFSKHSPVSEKLKQTMRREYLLMAVTFLAAAGFAAWMISTGRHQFNPQSLIFGLPLILAANCNSVRKVMEHIGTRSFDPLKGTRTIVGRSTLTRLLSFFDFDISVHGPHHRHPKLHHSQLSDRMGEIQAADPDQKYPVFPSFTTALVDTFRSAISDPSVGVNAGCTDDLSHLPGLKDSTPPTDGRHISAATATPESPASAA